MFYGGDLSNPYDFCYSFEVIHKGFEDYYLEKLNRLPMKEFEFCLQIQDRIIGGIDVGTQDKRDVELGDFSLPAEAFWKSATTFLDNFRPATEFSSDLIAEYTRDLDASKPDKLLEEGEFLNRAHDGKNCFYFFLKKAGKYFPVLPRKYFSVVFDKWGKILNEQYPSIEKEVKHYEIKVGVELCHFIKQRAQEERIFFICSAIQDDLKPHKTVFTTAFLSKNKLVVIHVLPPSTPGTTQQKFLESLIPELKEAQDLLAKSPARLGLHGEGKMVQFESSKGADSSPEPLIISVIPHITTDFGMIGQPNELVGEVVGLDQFLGVLDEIEDLDELADFFDYVESVRGSFDLSPFASFLDRFGSFKDSNSVLIQGADNPDLVALDPHWGTNYRFRSLTEFWKVFPQENFFGHPRSWLVEEETKNEKVLVLKSRNFMGYVYCCLLGSTSFFINCPAHALSFEQGKITDSLMGSLADAMTLYKDFIQELSFAKTGQKLHALFFPLSLIEKDPDFAHITHLKPSKEELWMMDITRLRRNNFGIRIVFDDQKILEVLRDAKDRSLQVALLQSVLREINKVFADSNLIQIEEKLEKEKVKKNRFRIFASRKRVSFPELARHTEPATHEFKLADKIIAQLGKENKVEPGKYEGKEAKEKIDLLKGALVTYLDNEVKRIDFKLAIPVLIRNIDAITEQHERKREQIKNSLDQEVDYERDVNLGESKQDFLHKHKDNRYLLEKFVQIQGAGTEELNQATHAKLLALVDRLGTLYAISDFLHYGIYPAKIEIERDYLVNINYGADINKMQTQWAQEQAQLNLGTIGNQDDRISNYLDIESYLNDLDDAFKKDLGFGLKDMVNIHHILCLWTAYTNTEEKTSYCATTEEIADVCSKNITGFDQTTTQKILDFLTLDPNKILTIEDDPRVATDLPVWEYRKRANRYSIKPLIKIGNQYWWGAHSVERAGRIWADIAGANKLPADIKAPTVVSVLEKGHQSDENALQKKIEEIVSRFTKNVIPNVYPHKVGFSRTDIGDTDVFVLLEQKNIILNIESKIIDQAYCHKDIKRIAEKVFGRTKSNGSFEEGYVQFVEKRAGLLGQRGEEMVEKFWGLKQGKPKIVSIFVTPSAYWWTKFPPITTDVNFVEVQLLDGFIKNL
jgi:hypothetical protein